MPHPGFRDCLHTLHRFGTAILCLSILCPRHGHIGTFTLASSLLPSLSSSAPALLSTGITPLAAAYELARLGSAAAARPRPSGVAHPSHASHAVPSPMMTPNSSWSQPWQTNGVLVPAAPLSAAAASTTIATCGELSAARSTPKAWLPAPLAAASGSAVAPRTSISSPKQLLHSTSPYVSPLGAPTSAKATKQSLKQSLQTCPLHGSHTYSRFRPETAEALLAQALALHPQWAQFPFLETFIAPAQPGQVGPG